MWDESTSPFPNFNTLRPRQNGRHFADDIFKCIFLNEIAWIPIKISLKCVPQGPINNIPALVQIMDWCRPGDKPLFGPIMVRLPTHICVTRPQWVKGCIAEVWEGMNNFLPNFMMDVYIHPWWDLSLKNTCTAMPTNSMESPYQCYRFVSQLVEIYITFIRSSRSLYIRPLAALWQSSMVDQHSCNPGRSFLRECWFPNCLKGGVSHLC